MLQLRSMSLVFFLLFAHNSFSKQQTTPEAKGETSTNSGQSDLSRRFYHPDVRLNKMVDSIYNAMNAKERASQMIMTASSTAEKLGYPFTTAFNLVNNDIAANVVFLKGSSIDFKQEAIKFNTAKIKQRQLKPLLACDCEPTLLPGKFTDITGITAASDQKNTDAVIQNTEQINGIIKKVGIQLNFAPVVDIALNKSVINKRSFGNNNKDIVTFSNQFVKTTQEAGLGATLKHFPGHGAVSGDTHKQSVFINGELTELPNFKALIEAEETPISVMVGHIVVKNNPKYNTNGLPATLSKVIITDLLRNELHFEGIITTDALNMAAAAKVNNADWKSVEAGVDLVLMPKNATLLNKTIVDALAKKDGMSKQLEASIKRIIRFKLLTQ